jgi:hypothetical protein
MELWGFIKSSALYLSVNMELSLRLHFYLRRSLRGYTVGTTAGFPVEIVEALAPQSHHQIPWACPQYHMSTYSAHHRVTGSNHPLRRGGSGDTVGVTYPKYHGPPVMAQKILDTIATLQRQMVGEPHTPYQETAPPLKSEEGPPT